MAKIKQTDLESLSDNDVRFIYLLKDDEYDILPPNIKEYVVGDGLNKKQRMMRIKSLLQQIAINRFMFPPKKGKTLHELILMGLVPEPPKPPDARIIIEGQKPIPPKS